MRLENASPRTWLLAATAGWAVASVLLALFGMGGRIEPLAEDASLVRPLPVLPRIVPERLGPLAQYTGAISRPLFADDRRPHPFSLQPQGEETAKAFDYVLTSVMITPTFRMAIIQAPDARTPPLRIKLGEADESLPNWRLQSLDARSAVFAGPEGERRLELRVFDGTGGEAPTAVTRTEPRPPAQPGVASSPAAPAAPLSTNPVSTNPGVAPAPEKPGPQGPVEVPGQTAPATSQAMTEQAQMEAIRKRIEARRAQLRQEALRQQQQQPKPPVQ